MVGKDCGAGGPGARAGSPGACQGSRSGDLALSFAIRFGAPPLTSRTQDNPNRSVCSDQDLSKKDPCPDAS